ncbi:hypothetical protein SAMN05421820_104224 [Pedobacter steynii]|uniref:Uncharacterized protein n=1 Tax=Pedobacter steynii TaxID=430522 RepID=A0A1G9UN29_9SPHI|nr:hypothetical protein [Pedobacter steynii]NQX40820.1 hypothetical protein [Pedobacter steynii]SDM61340.1 hypothetical protein SAMN05421820_104224 [Pedobacter steynii]
MVNRIHYFSGLILSVFIAFHLANQLFSLFGAEAHIELMTLLRTVYRHIVVETVLLFAVAFQVATGIRLSFKKGKKSIVERVQLYSGLYLSLFLIVHVTAVMYGRQLQLDTNFYFAAAGMNIYPATFIFIPYYFFAVVAVTLHLASLHYLKTKSAKVSYSIAIIGITVSILMITGYTDAFNWRTIPVEYENFIKGVLPTKPRVHFLPGP